MERSAFRIELAPYTRRLYIATDNGSGADSYLYTYSVQ